jgi:methylenetetrahydrofolate dehydrogenase (NADP+)/methenyltetrahydrofolate cyclohydrolase
VQQILHRHGIPVSGKHVVVIGRSDIVGKPLALMLMQRSSPLGESAANATVTVCHSRTHHLADIARQADVLVAAAGVPGLITQEMVKHGATVIDVGVNRVVTAEGKSKTVGDVAFEQVSKVAGHISPVPGGVGPVTVAMLLLNVVESAERKQ